MVFLTPLNDRGVILDLSTPLPLQVSLCPSLSFLLPLGLLITLHFEYLSLTLDAVCMVLMFDFFLHLGLLLSQLLLSLYLFNDSHLAGVIVAQFLQVGMHFRLLPIDLGSFEIGLQFLALLLHLLLYHLYSAVA